MAWVGENLDARAEEPPGSRDVVIGLSLGGRCSPALGKNPLGPRRKGRDNRLAAREVLVGGAYAHTRPFG